MKISQFIKGVFFVILSMNLLFGHGFAATISLDFDTLPSAQGFDYFSTGSSGSVLEANAFNVDGTMLHQTMTGMAEDKTALYRDLDALETGLDTELILTAKVLDYDKAIGPGSNGLGFNVIINNNYGVHLGFTDSKVWLSGGLVQHDFDTDDDFHDYRVTLSGDGTVNFYIDGSLIDTFSAPLSAPGDESKVTFGDRTEFENVNIDISTFSITQTQNIVPVPSEIPKTGQTETFYSGDDGDLEAGVAWPSPRFIVNADTSLTDSLTGLSWVPDANTPTISGCIGGKKSWQSTFDYVDCLNDADFLGHDDWRVPNINELRSLVNYSQQYPANWLRGQGFNNFQNDNYWSSTISATTSIPDGEQLWSWKVNFYDGIKYYGKNTPGFSEWVLPVRGPDAPGAVTIPRTGQTATHFSGDDGDIRSGVAWPVPRFTVNPDSSVTDELTRLIWTVDANLMPVRDPGWDPNNTDDGRISWENALDYIAKLNSENYLGHNNWRLPNANEMVSLGDISQIEPSLPTGNPFINVQSNSISDARYYWTSTTQYYASMVWFYDMYEGQLGARLKSQYHFMWPVRDCHDTDQDGICDVFDSDTIYGTVSGDVQEDITVNIYHLTCGVAQPHATVTTDAQGYYAIGDIEDGMYLVGPDDVGYSFSSSYWVDIPQAAIQSYDFTATAD